MILKIFLDYVNFDNLVDFADLVKFAFAGISAILEKF